MPLHVIFTSSGSGGDVLPFLRFGRGLRERGHDVTLISHCCYQDRAARAGMDFAPLDSSEEYSRFIKDGPLLNTPPGIPEFMRRHSLPRVPVELELISRSWRRGETVLVTRDMFDIAARVAVEKLGIPAFWVFAGPSQLATSKLRLPLFRDLLASDLNRLRAELGLSPVQDWASWLGYPQRSIALWPDWFAPAEPDWPVGVVPVGFMADSEVETGEIPDEVQAILDSGEAPVLITGGTGMYLGAEFYTVSAEACRLLNRRGILVTQYQKQLPKHLPDCVRWFGYLPFRTLMRHMGAVIHHGGMGTLSCATAAGIPQLVLAMGADRPDNALRLQRLGVAEYLPPPAWQPSTVAEKLRKVTKSQAIRERCKDLARRVAVTDPLTATCKIIEDTIPIK